MRKYLFTFILIVLITFMNKYLYALVFNFVPGAGVIRAANRIILLLLPVFVYGIANFLHNFSKKKIVYLLILLITAEQFSASLSYGWTKTEHLKRINSYPVPKNCDVVYYDIKGENPYFNSLKNVDIMYLGTLHNFYTLNGYSAYIPEMQTHLVPEQCKVDINSEKEDKFVFF